MWKRLAELSRGFFEKDNNRLRLDRQELEEIRKKIEELKDLIGEAIIQLNGLAAKGKRDEFPKEASFIPVARRQIKEWEEVLKEKRYLLKNNYPGG